jgi:hypothetical protein
VKSWLRPTPPTYLHDTPPESARRRPRMAVDYTVIVVYLAGMLAMG